MNQLTKAKKQELRDSLLGYVEGCSFPTSVIETISALLDENERIQERVREREAMLRRLEWVDNCTCPICGGYIPEHDEDCPPAELLRKGSRCSSE